MTFLTTEMDLMRDMMAELWDSMRHHPEYYSDQERKASETLYAKLKELGAV